MNKDRDREEREEKFYTFGPMVLKEPMKMVICMYLHKNSNNIDVSSLLAAIQNVERLFAGTFGVNYCRRKFFSNSKYIGKKRLAIGSCFVRRRS